MVERASRLIALTVAAIGVVLLVGAGWIPGIHPDADAYWLAAMRIRDGAALYLPAGSYSSEIEIYRYAPWFAYAWVPLTWLPQEVAYTIWRGLLVGGAVATVLPVLRRPSPAGIVLAILTFGLLISNVPAANVTALIVGGLSLALPTRAGPVVLGLAGSLKVFPLLLVAGYIAERRWRDAIVALGVASVLWANMLLFDVSTYPTTFGGVSLFGVSAAIWPMVAGAMVALLAWLAWRRSRWTWLAAAAAIPVVVPRVWLPDAAYPVSTVATLERDHPSEDGRVPPERRKVKS